MICCPCDELIHPLKPAIPAGLDALPRQLAGFPEYRRALLRSIPEHRPLADWRAREGDDLGLMLLEMWAYVLDVLGFYDERIANEAYLRTAVRRPSLRRLVELIGYLPRPALGASVVLAAIADGRAPVTLPPGTGFRSGAFDGEAPQIFESEVETVIHPLRNEWTVGPVREDAPGPELLLETRTAGLAAGRLVVFRTAALHPARVAAVETVEALDGETYARLEVDSPPTFGAGVKLSDIELLSPSLRAASSPFSLLSGSVAANEVVLDAVYPQIVPQDVVVVERRGALRARTVSSTTTVEVKVSTSPVTAASVTKVALSVSLPAGWSSGPLTVHFNMVDGGRLTRRAKTRLTLEDFHPEEEGDTGGLELEGPVEAPPPPAVDELLLHDANGDGLQVEGSLDFPGEGRGKLRIDPGEGPWDPGLRVPVKAYGNLLPATRGESVQGEVLGSGDPSQAFQTFALAKSPLTYFNDASAPSGRRSTLAVRVNGILWREVASFFGAGPEDEVYAVRQNDDGESLVVFGDGVRGARLPSGVGNVVADYRFGAGAAKPPAGGITQLAKPVKGLRRVLNPVAAGGGADAEAPEDIRSTAPRSALTLGRAVSLLDFEAIASSFGGVVNARASWAWANAYQRAVVKVSFISDGGDIAQELYAHLRGQSSPETPIEVEEAVAVASRLGLDLVIDERHDAGTVKLAVAAALSDPETGLLAHENIPIGCPLFRSRIFEQALGVEGVVAVAGITVDDATFPIALTADEGHYRDFLPLTLD